MWYIALYNKGNQKNLPAVHLKKGVAEAIKKHYEQMGFIAKIEKCKIGGYKVLTKEVKQ